MCWCIPEHLIPRIVLKQTAASYHMPQQGRSLSTSAHCQWITGYSWIQAARLLLSEALQVFLQRAGWFPTATQSPQPSVQPASLTTAQARHIIFLAFIRCSHPHTSPWLFFIYLFAPTPLVNLQVCIRGGPSITSLYGAAQCSTKKYYTVTRGDACSTIISKKYRGSTALFQSLNSGFVCQNSKLYVGLKLCSP